MVTYDLPLFWSLPGPDFTCRAIFIARFCAGLVTRNDLSANYHNYPCLENVQPPREIARSCN